MKIISFDGDGITTPIIPRTCKACGTLIDRLYLTVDMDITVTAGELEGGLRSVGRAPCCGDRRPARISGELLAQAIEKVNCCPRHRAQQEPDVCRHPRSTSRPTGRIWITSCPDCPARAYAICGPVPLGPFFYPA
jgi:hypothetical protein